MSTGAKALRASSPTWVPPWRWRRHSARSWAASWKPGWAGGRITRRLGVERLVRIGGLISAIGGLALVAIIWITGANIPGILLPTIVYMVGTGLVLPNAMAGAIGPFPRLAGTAAALLGFLQM